MILFTHSNFVKDELQKDDKIKVDLLVTADISFLNDFLVNHENEILIYHIDSSNEQKELEKLLINFPNIKTIALSNTPSNNEACKYLSMGFKSYLHSMSSIEILKDAISTVSKNNVYVYPELMNFLISNAPALEQYENPSLDILSNKELAVLKKLSDGKSNKAIAKELDIAEITVKKHISSMFEKLEVKDRLSLALLYKK